MSRYRPSRDVIIGRAKLPDKYSDIFEINYESAQGAMIRLPEVEEIQIFNFDTQNWECFFFRDNETHLPICIYDHIEIESV